MKDAEAREQIEDIYQLIIRINEVGSRVTTAFKDSVALQDEVNKEHTILIVKLADVVEEITQRLVKLEDVIYSNHISAHTPIH
jgi:chemotaxis regulatin CheY-phosphate phosphatase CheZ